VAPTIRALLGIAPSGAAAGRVLREALRDGPDPGDVALTRETLEAAAGGWRQAVEVAAVEGTRYVLAGRAER